MTTYHPGDNGITAAGDETGPLVLYPYGMLRASKLMVMKKGKRSRATPQIYNSDGSVFIPQPGEENDHIVGLWPGRTIEATEATEADDGWGPWTDGVLFNGVPCLPDGHDVEVVCIDGKCRARSRPRKPETTTQVLYGSGRILTGNQFPDDTERLTLTLTRTEAGDVVDVKWERI